MRALFARLGGLTIHWRPRSSIRVVLQFTLATLTQNAEVQKCRTKHVEESWPMFNYRNTAKSSCDTHHHLGRTCTFRSLPWRALRPHIRRSLLWNRRSSGPRIRRSLLWKRRSSGIWWRWWSTTWCWPIEWIVRWHCTVDHRRCTLRWS